MSRPDASDATGRFAASPLLPQDDDGPVFAEPWQAQAFAIAVQLSAEGHFTWTEWTIALGEQLDTAVRRGAGLRPPSIRSAWIVPESRYVLLKRVTCARWRFFL